MSQPRYDEDLEALVRQFQASDLVELHVRTADLELFLSRDPGADLAFGEARTASTAATRAAAPAATLAPAPVAISVSAPSELPDGQIIVRAPYLGTFYRAPKPGEADFVALGQTVEAGADLCLVEVMKLFTTVHAEVRGIVRHVYARDGEMVSEGQALFALEPVD